MDAEEEDLYVEARVVEERLDLELKVAKPRGRPVTDIPGGYWIRIASKIGFIWYLLPAANKREPIARSSSFKLARDKLAHDYLDVYAPKAETSEQKP